MMMPYKKIPKRFTIEMVHRVTMLINSLPKQKGIHSILSPRGIITGKKFRCPSIKIGQYVQGHTGGSNDTEQKRSIDSLYIGRADNGSGHVVFKLNTKQLVSVNRVTPIPTNEAIIKTVNDMAEQERQPEGIEFSDMNSGITLQDFAEGFGDDDDSNASDEDFKIDQEYQDEIDNEIKLDKQEVNTNDADPDSQGFGNDEPDSQIDYFQNPIQQHNRDVQNNNEPASDIIPRSNRDVDPIVAVNCATAPTVKQECGERKKKNGEDEDVSLDNDLDDINISSTQDAKAGVDNTHNDNDTIDTDDNNGATIPRELDSDLGPYWALAHKAQAYVLTGFLL
jgi:hypothetical protein